jgi:hypothetical protein
MQHPHLSQSYEVPDLQGGIRRRFTEDQAVLAYGIPPHRLRPQLAGQEPASGGARCLKGGEGSTPAGMAVVKGLLLTIQPTNAGLFRLGGLGRRFFGPPREARQITEHRRSQYFPASRIPTRCPHPLCGRSGSKILADPLASAYDLYPFKGQP